MSTKREQTQKRSLLKQDTEKKDSPSNFRYGPLPKLSNHYIWCRGIIILGVVVYMWYNSKSNKEVLFAEQKDFVIGRSQNVDCDLKYLEEISQYPKCVPQKCGRFVTDKLVTGIEATVLFNLATKALSFVGTSGSASILDLHSGAVSYGDKFVNFFSLEGANDIITPTDLAIYRIVKNKIQHAIAERFGIDSDYLYLTHPTFFSKLTSMEAKTIHDEYWHIHVDKETYESFHFTSLVYLTDFNLDFKGGRFVFVDDIDKPFKNTTVDPKKGRVLMFTSGAENPHYVEKVTNGVRYAITVSFTCDSSKAINDLSKH